MVNGMIEFQESYTGKIWMEFMAVKGINDNFESLNETRNLYEKIQPDRIYINTPIRPPCEDWVQTPSLENIELIQKILSPTAKDKIISINLEEQGEFFIEGYNEDEIILNLVNTIKRHPMRLDQVNSVLEKKKIRHSEEIIEKILEKNVKQTDFQGKIFLSFYEP
jgi:wyosine [tRNA(Phe)-imidazoG37] synthetase (radical SAM superfamily)